LSNNNKSFNYKPYKSRGKTQGFHKRYHAKPHEKYQRGDHHENDQRREQNHHETDHQQEQEQKYEYSYQKNQGYYDNGRYAAPEYIDQQEYKFICDFPRARDYSNIQAVAQTFPHLKDVNGDTLDISGLKDVRCFIMRSNNEDDIHKAIKYGIWTSTSKSNEFLNNLFEECSAKNIPIFLFYSVVRSGQFVGVAQMTSKIIEKSFQFWWEPEKWVNHFQIKWQFIKDVPYKYFSHLYMEDDLPVTRARDCTGVPGEVTKEMLQIYKDYEPYNSIFSAFPFMDIREDMLRSYKSSLPYQFYLNAGDTYNNGYGMQTSANPAYQTSQQYFKYNSFPAKQKETQSRSFSPQKTDQDKLEELYKEFDITFSFYDEEKKKWVKDGETTRAQIANETEKSKEKYEEFNSKFENLKSREKEIMEGLEVLENKYKLVTQGVQEYEQKGIEQTVKDKIEKKVKELTAVLEGFKEGFNNSKKDFLSLYEKIQGFKSA